MIASPLMKGTSMERKKKKILKPEDMLEQIYALKNHLSNLKLKIIEMQDEQEKGEHMVEALIKEWRTSVSRERQ